MLTFCDNSAPPVKQALEDKESPFYKVRHKISEPWFLKFNNSAIYQQNDDD